MNATCTVNNTLDLRNVTSIPLWLVYLPNEWIVYYVIWPSLIIFGVLSNASFIWTVIRIPTLHTSTYIYLVSLACADLLNLSSSSFLNVINYIASPFRHDNRIIRDIIYFIHTIAYLSSTGFVTLVSLERYLAICHPIKHHLLKGTKRAYKLIGIVSVASVVYIFAAIPAFIHQKSNTKLCLIWPDEN